MTTFKDIYTLNSTNIYNNLNLYDVVSSNSISISAPLLAGNYPLVLPNVQGSLGEVLINDGSGNLDYDIINQQNANTGFEAWTGTGNYWSITDGPTFNLLRGGTGYIKNRPITFAGSQNIIITINESNYIYIDSDGLIQKTTSSINLYENNIVIFEILHDGTNYVVKKENHPVDFQARVSVFFHNNLGCIIQGSGAILTASATARKLKIVGSDIIEDHGLQSIITEADLITILFYYTNASGQWIQYANTDTIPNVYNNAGTVTAIGTNRYGVFRIYALLDDLNTSTSKYCAVMDDSDYKNSGEVLTAINEGLVIAATNELFSIEPCQLGYVIIQNSGGGVVNSVIVEKNTFNSRLVGGGTSGSHLLLADINTGPYLMGSHTGMAQRHISATSAPVASDDIANFLQSCVWIKEDTDDIYINTDNSTTAAVWKLMARENEESTFTNIITTGSVRKSITSVGSALILSNIHHILSITTTVASYNITLPASGTYTGIQYIFVYTSKTAAYTVSIVRAGTDTIDNALTSLTLTNQHDRFTLTDLGGGKWYSNL